MHYEYSYFSDQPISNRYQLFSSTREFEVVCGCGQLDLVLNEEFESRITLLLKSVLRQSLKSNPLDIGDLWIR